MRKLRYSDERIASIIMQKAAGARLNRVCCEHEISPPTFYKWRRLFQEHKPELLQQTPEQAKARRDALNLKHSHHHPSDGTNPMRKVIQADSSSVH